MAEQMVRYVLAAALRFVQRFDVYARQQRDGAWEQHEPRAPSSIRAGVMGLGVIGAPGCARAGGARLCGARLCAFGEARGRRRRFTRATRGSTRSSTVSTSWSCVLPATPATEGILNRRNAVAAGRRRACRQHRPGRGARRGRPRRAGRAGKLGGATLDVFRKEPLPADHPFWRGPEIVVTPHISGLTVPDAAITQIADKIMRLERGEPVTGVVAFERGY